MKLIDMITIASKAYDPDDTLLKAYEAETRGIPYSGDGLAVFIVNELRDVYDEDARGLDNLDEAGSALDSAVSQLLDVSSAFDRCFNNELDNLKSGKSD